MDVLARKPLPLFNGTGAGKIMSVLHLERKIAGDKKTVTSSYGDMLAVIDFSDPGLDCTVVETGNQLQPEGHPAGDPLNNTQDLPVGIMFSSFSHGETVQEAGLAGLGLKGGLQHQGILEIAA